jgi:hypothetical protein
LEDGMTTLDMTLDLVGSIHRFIARGPISFIEIGTSLTGPFFNVTVAVPLYVVVIPLFVGLPVILKSVIVCLWGAFPFSITILKVALKAGELELIFFNSHPPESIYSGFPSFPFCMLAIDPNLEPDVCDC